MNYDYKVNIKEKNNAHTQCLNLIEPNSKILDVGCAVGALGEYLHNEKNCKVFGIDFLDEYINVCESKKCYEKLFKIDLNHLNSQLDEYIGYFDYILLADVIEHIYSPEDVLNKMKKYLNTLGKMVISIPNIAHASIKFNLLKNDFKYTEMGLLDSTHIRFFTKNSIVQLMDKLQLQIEDFDFVIQPFSTSHESVNANDFPFGVLEYIANADESYVYQYILKVKIQKEHDNCNILKFDDSHKKLIGEMRQKIKMEYLKHLVFGKK